MGTAYKRVYKLSENNWTNIQLYCDNRRALKPAPNLVIVHLSLRLRRSLVATQRSTQKRPSSQCIPLLLTYLPTITSRPRTQFDSQCNVFYLSNVLDVQAPDFFFKNCINMKLGVLSVYCVFRRCTLGLISSWSAFPFGDNRLGLW